MNRTATFVGETGPILPIGPAMLADLAALLLAPLYRLTDLGDPFSALSLVGALVFATLLALGRRGTLPGRSGLAAKLRRLRAFRRLAFARRVWAHPSAKLDYRLFFVTTFFYATGAVELVVTSHAVEQGVISGLDHLFGRPEHTPSGPALIALVTVADLLLFEFAYWFVHWLLHRVPALWAFHSLHHSAEVLTPFTEWRQHPVELFLFPAINAVIIGSFFGLTHHLLGPDAQPLSLFGFDVLQLVGVMTVLHLRHTHLWITVPDRWARIVQTPAHHQIHHSADVRHFDTNLGLLLSVWDWAFGTLWIPRDADRRRLTLGIGEGLAHRGVVDAWVRPMVDSGRAVAAAFHPAPVAPVAAPPPRLPAE